MARMSLRTMDKYQKLTNSHRSDDDNGFPLYAIRNASVLWHNLGRRGRGGGEVEGSEEKQR